MTTVDRIFELIKESGLTAKDFAKKVGVSQGNITDWKTGRAKPSVESLQKIAKYTGVRLEWLTGDSKFKTDEEHYNYFMKSEQELAILETAERYYDEYIVPCSISEGNLNYISELITNLNPQNIKETKKAKKDFINTFPVELQPKVTEFFDILIKSVINDMDRKNTYYYLASLVDKTKNVKEISKLCDVPIVGKITAGQPILVKENIEGYLPVDPNIYGLTTADDLFYLRVSGESMNLKVHNGDYALIRKQDYAENGDIVVAIVNSDDEATLKRYKKINNELVMLEPMSTYPMEPIVINLKETKFLIVGKAIGQFGKF